MGAAEKEKLIADQQTNLKDLLDECGTCQNSRNLFFETYNQLVSLGAEPSGRASNIFYAGSVFI